MVETVTIVAADGTAIPLDGSTNYTMSDGPDGRFATVWDLVSEALPNDGGTRLRNITPKPRTISLPLEIAGADAITTRIAWRQLVAALDPRRGDVLLQFTPPDGITREYRCRYAQGMEGDDSPAKASPDQTEYLVTPQFTAFDPMAEDAADTVQVWTTADGGGKFFPIFPLRLGASSVLSEKTIPVLGDDYAWPLWTITGPLSQLELTNVTMARTLKWGGTLDLGETLTIDTRPGYMSADPKSVRDATGKSRFTELTAWDLWPFNPGQQRVRVGGSGATPDTQVTATYRSRWEMT